MAHVGRIYPVIDRRDLSINVNRYDAGWERRYLVTLHNMPPGIAHNVETIKWDCGPGGVTDAGLVFWQSQPEIIGPFAYDVVLEASLDNNRQFIKGFRVREAIAGDIGIFRCALDPAPYYPNFPLFNTWPATFLDPFFFTPPSTLAFANPLEKTWNDPPPH